MGNLFLQTEGGFFKDELQYQYLGAWYVEVIEYNHGYVKKSLVTHLTPAGQDGILTFRIPVSKSFVIEAGGRITSEQMKTLAINESQKDSNIKNIEYYFIDNTKMCDISPFEPKSTIGKKKNTMPIMHESKENDINKNIFMISYSAGDDVILSVDTEMQVAKWLFDRNRKFIVLVVTGQAGEVNFITKTSHKKVTAENYAVRNTKEAKHQDDGKFIIGNRYVTFKLTSEGISSSEKYISDETENSISSIDLFSDEPLPERVPVIIKTAPESVKFKNVLIPDVNRVPKDKAHPRQKKNTKGHKSNK